MNRTSNPIRFTLIPKGKALQYSAWPIFTRIRKCEQFNDFIIWIRFGADGVIRENDRDEQRKIIKYNHLVANCVILHNVCTLTRLLSQLAKEGHTFDEATIGQVSPYIREQINWFGDYLLNMDRGQPLPTYDLGFLKNK